MEKNTTNNRSKNAEGFLIAEYEHFAGSFWRNEEAGERRVNFLIVLVTASITVLTAVAKGEIDTPQSTEAVLLVGFALVALLVLGFVTLQRMLRRNVVSDEYKYLMDYIRSQFTEGTRIEDYQPFDSGDIRKWTRTRKVGTGGLAEVVAVINSLVVAGLVLLLTQSCSCPLSIRISFSFMAFIIAVVAQYLYITFYYRLAADKHSGE